MPTFLQKNVTKVAFLVALLGWLLVLTLRADAYEFNHVQYIRCYDGDTCTFHIPNAHPLIGKKIGVRLLGIDTPELRTNCEADKIKAREARDFVNALLRNAFEIHLREVHRGKYFRLLAIIEADGQNVSNILLKKNLAVPYFGKGPRWLSLCLDPESP